MCENIPLMMNLLLMKCGVNMEQGMVFDLHQDGQETKRVMAMNNNDVVDLKTLKIIKNIDEDNEIGDIIHWDILEY